MRGRAEVGTLAGGGPGAGAAAWIRRRPWLAVLVGAWALLAGIGVVCQSFVRPDEIYQTMEPAHRLWSGWGIVSWEWRDGIRSWLFPAMLAGLMELSGWLRLGQGGYLPLITVTMALVPAAVVVAAFALGRQSFGLRGGVLCAIALGLWPDLLLFGPRTLTEIQGGNLLVIATVLATLAAARGAPWSRRGFAGLGVLLGLVLCLRLQLAPALPVIAIWACRGRLRECWIPLLLGAAGPVAALGLVDAVTLGSPFQSIWKNVAVNLIEHKSLIYGVQPAHWYVAEAVRRWGAAVLPIGLLFAYGAWRAPLAALVAVIVVAVHSAVAHKEYSFIYPALLLGVMVAAIGTARLLDRLQARRPFLLLAGFGWIWFAATAAIASELPLRLTLLRPYLSAMQTIGRQPDLCGVGLYGPSYYWLRVGGYTYLDAAVPMSLARNAAELAAATPAMNYILTDGEGSGPALPVPGYDVLQCRDEVCVMRRPGPCTPQPDAAADAVLARAGL